MPAPYSYLGGVQPVDLSPQVQSIAANLGAGLAAALQTSAAQQQAQLQAQQQAAMQAQLAEDMRDYAAAPSVEKFGLLLGRYPQMKKQLESVQSRLTEEDRQAAQSFLGSTLSFLQGGQNNFAIESINRRNEALANSSVPNKEALIANGKALIRAIESGDEGVNSAIGALIRDYALASGTSDPAKFAELNAQLPHAASYAKGRADKISAQAREAEEKAKQLVIKTGFVADAEKAGIAVTEAQALHYSAMADVARENVKINWARLAQEKAENEADRKAAEAKEQEARNDRNAKIAEKKGIFDAATTRLDNAISLIGKIVSFPPGVREKAHGPIQSEFWKRYPTARSQEVANYMELVETLGSVNFATIAEGLNMAGVAKAETDKLQAALGSLSLAQDVKQFDEALATIKSFFESNKRILQEKYGAIVQGIPVSGAPLPEAEEQQFQNNF